MLEKGLVQAYTGEGKGKTTAALGLALRAVGQGLRVYILQFMKGNGNGGEMQAAKFLPNLVIEQFGLKGVFFKGDDLEVHKKNALEGLKKAKEIMLTEKYDIVILDEINIALNYNLIPLEEVLKLIIEKPPKIELILTGRKLHPEIEKLADLISEIKMVKHPYTKGIKARRGIEF